MWSRFSEAQFEKPCALGVDVGQRRHRTSLTVCTRGNRLCDALAAQGVLEVKLSRKIIHIGTGPLFIATWPLFSEASSARYMAALVPLSICLQFAAVGLGFLKYVV